MNAQDKHTFLRSYFKKAVKQRRQLESEKKKNSSKKVLVDDDIEDVSNLKVILCSVDGIPKSKQQLQIAHMIRIQNAISNSIKQTFTSQLSKKLSLLSLQTRKLSSIETDNEQSELKHSKRENTTRIDESVSTIVQNSKRSMSKFKRKVKVITNDVKKREYEKYSRNLKIDEKLFSNGRGLEESKNYFMTKRHSH